MTTYLILLGVAVSFSSLVSWVKVFLDKDKELQEIHETVKWGFALLMSAVISVVVGIVGLILFILISEIVIPLALHFTINAILMIATTFVGLTIPVVITYRKNLVASAQNFLESKREKLLQE